MIAGSLVQELESELPQASPYRRGEMLRKVTDLLVATAPLLPDAGFTAFDEVIGFMARDIEFRARVELSERLSRLSRAPPKMMEELASDPALAVAQPVLEHYRDLSEDAIARVACRLDEDRLTAIARRSVVSERLTDIIVTGGGPKSVRVVAANRGARFTRAGFDRLADRATKDGELGRILTVRLDIPVDILLRLTEAARRLAAHSLQHDMPEGSPPELDAILSEVTEEIRATQNSVALVTDTDGAEQEAADLAAKGLLKEASIGEFLRAGNVHAALAAIGILSKAPFSVVRNAFHAPIADALLFIVKSVPLSWTIYVLLLTAKNGHALTDEFLASEGRNYRALSIQTAQRVTRFMALRAGAEEDAAA